MTRVFIGGLSETTTREDVELLCAEAASPSFISMKKGYAFARFDSEQDALAVVDALHGTEMNQRRLRVELAREPVCFVCNQEGHMARSCPNREPDPPARAPDSSVTRPRVWRHAVPSLSQTAHCETCTCFQERAFYVEQVDYHTPARPAPYGSVAAPRVFRLERPPQHSVRRRSRSPRASRWER